MKTSEGRVAVSLFFVDICEGKLLEGLLRLAALRLTLVVSSFASSLRLVLLQGVPAKRCEGGGMRGATPPPYMFSAVMKSFSFLSVLILIMELRSLTRKSW